MDNDRRSPAAERAIPLSIGAILAGVALIGGAFYNGFLQVSDIQQRVAKNERHLQHVDAQFAMHDGKFATINRDLKDLIAEQNKQLNAINIKLATLGSGWHEIKTRLDRADAAAPTQRR
jgi:hypothetical protein